ncbi:MAG TPA: transcriptional coactivator p15/PC4 family protein [Anaerolineae bacterium]|nr:transcriptional coactivator p15/PC4 family protein [Anaerolineae bacterium]
MAENEETRIIGEIEVVPGGDVIVVSSGTFKGRDYVDVRRYYRKEDGSIAPTAKGVRVSPDDVEVLIDLLKKSIED